MNTSTEQSATDESSTSRVTSWPVGWYLVTMVFSFGAMVLLTPWLNEWLSEGARTLSLYIVAMLMMCRLIVAIATRERNKQGQLYIAGMLMLPVLWYALEIYLLPSLQRWMR